MVYLFLILAAVLFMIGIKVLRLVPISRSVIENSRQAVTIVRSTELDDHDKEAAIQRAAINMIGALFSILLRTLLIFLVPIGVVLLFSLTGLYTTDEAVQAASNGWFILGSSALMIGLLIWMK